MDIKSVNNQTSIYNKPSVKNEVKTDALKNTNISVTPQETTQEGTIVSFSSEALQQIKNEKKDSSDTPFNSEKVEALKLQIKDGTYKPNINKIADSILSDLQHLFKK